MHRVIFATHRETIAMFEIRLRIFLPIMRSDDDDDGRFPVADVS